LEPNFPSATNKIFAILWEGQLFRVPRVNRISNKWIKKYKFASPRKYPTDHNWILGLTKAPFTLYKRIISPKPLPHLNNTLLNRKNI